MSATSWFRWFGFAVCTLAPLGGCAAEIDGRVEAPVVETPHVAWVTYDAPPMLVSVGDVAVVEDADYPVYFVDGAYWSPRGGVWYRTGAYDAPWVVVDERVVPVTIVHRHHADYVHYHARADERRYRAEERREEHTGARAHADVEVRRNQRRQRRPADAAFVSSTSTTTTTTTTEVTTKKVDKKKRRHIR